MINLNSLKSLSQVQTPKNIRVFAFCLLLLVALGIPALVFVPWQQTVMGTGRVTSFSPNDRPQTIESPIKGRIKKWHVHEGMKVKQGDLIVELQDLEKEFLPPQVIQLTQASRDALINNQQSYMQKAESIQSSVSSLRQNLGQSLNAAKQSVLIAQTDLRTAKLNLERTKALSKKGLTSERDKELAIQAEIKAAGDLQRAQIEVDRISSKTLSDITKLESDRSSALADAAKTADEIAKLDIKLSTAEVRQDISHIRSPRDGIVVRLFKRGPGETFKESEAVAVITPETVDQAAEVFVRDIDAPLISIGKPVRLQFSGWPALQFAGFSKSVKIGTFAGIVAVVDNVNSANGKYRVLVIPDKTGPPWPSPKYLRPGTQAASWIILKTVPFGYELWRRFNGFPIALSDLYSGDKDFYEEYTGKKEEPEEKPKSFIYSKKNK
jgi:adhesin transport system membrane fusion protein